MDVRYEKTQEAHTVSDWRVGEFKRHAKYRALPIERWCCDAMRRHWPNSDPENFWTAGRIAFGDGSAETVDPTVNVTSRYEGDVSAEFEIAFCPFCGEKIELEEVLTHSPILRSSEAA